MQSYENWLGQVRQALDSMNMPMDDWQKAWRFDFEKEYRAGTLAVDAAGRANRSWWREQNRAIRQDCLRTSDCWLPGGHDGPCQAVS